MANNGMLYSEPVTLQLLTGVHPKKTVSNTTKPDMTSSRRPPLKFRLRSRLMVFGSCFCVNRSIYEGFWTTSHVFNAVGSISGLHGLVSSKVLFCLLTFNSISRIYWKRPPVSTKSFPVDCQCRKNPANMISSACPVRVLWDFCTLEKAKITVDQDPLASVSVATECIKDGQQ